MAFFAPEERERLLALLLRDGILYASENQTVRSRDGKSARWMLDSLSFSLRAEGAELAGRALLGLLGRFEGRQIATYGITAIPLLASCVSLAGGRLNGLLVRKERKPYGSSKKIEGRIDPREPTILIDDSVASGTNVLEGIAALEEAGIWVEGVVCLVRFGYYGGVARLQERGYHVESVFDIYSDVMEAMPDEESLVRNPTKLLPRLAWSEGSLAEGLAPPAAARLAIESWLASGRVPRPPLTLDRSYDSEGGVWVSLRDREEIYRRPAREGFWHFPDDGAEEGAAAGPFAEGPPGAPRDLMVAAAKTAAALPAGAAGLEQLQRCAIAVTFFSRLEEVRPGRLDNDVYGIVVRSRERPGKMGGALPRMPGIASAWREFEHARRRNAGLLSFEPYELFRHRVEKVVEPGAEWQQSGVPRPALPPPIEDAARVAPICRHARQVVLATLGLAADLAAEPPIGELELPGLDTLFLSVYLGGHLRGCMGSKISSLAADLPKLAALAVKDSRFPDYAAGSAADVAVTLAFLHQPLTLGDFSPGEVMERIRLGEQALMVYQGDRLGLLLPSAASSLALDAESFALEVIDKAGITRPPYIWRRFECSAWCADGGAPRRLVGALPRADASIGGEELAGLQLRFLLRLVREDGGAYFFYRPHQDRLSTGLDLPRRAHLAWVLARAARLLPGPEVAAVAERVRAALAALVAEGEGEAWLAAEGERPAIAESAFLLLALCEAERPTAEETRLAERLAATLWSKIGAHGRIATHRDETAEDEPFQDFFPGQALLALAGAAFRGFAPAQRDRLAVAFRFYRHRFRHRRHFGQISWMAQAFAVWSRLLGWREAADFVAELAELALEHQHEDGSFSSPLQPEGPGYTSALFLEALAVAHALARDHGEAEAASRLGPALARGIELLGRLTLRPEHASLLPNPAWAIGGLRHSELRDEVRIDFVQHALSVLLETFEGQPAPPARRATGEPSHQEAQA